MPMIFGGPANINNNNNSSNNNSNNNNNSSLISGQNYSRALLGSCTGEVALEAWATCTPAGYVMEERRLATSFATLAARIADETPFGSNEELQDLFRSGPGGQAPTFLQLLRPKDGLVYFLYFWKAYSEASCMAGIPPTEGLDSELETLRDAILRRVEAEEALQKESRAPPQPPGLWAECLTEEVHRTASMSAWPKFWQNPLLQLAQRPQNPRWMLLEEVSGRLLSWVSQAAVAVKFTEQQGIPRHLNDCPSGMPVYLHVYDVSKSEGIHQLNRFLAYEASPVKFGGIFHTGVEVHGLEWSFNYSPSKTRPGISCLAPRRHPHHHYRETIDCGFTTVPFTEINWIISEMWEDYPGRDYDILRRNCCHFADDLLKRLGLEGVPGWVHRLARIGENVENALLLAQALREALSVSCAGGCDGSSTHRGGPERRSARSRQAGDPQQRRTSVGSGAPTRRPSSSAGAPGFAGGATTTTTAAAVSAAAVPAAGVGRSLEGELLEESKAGLSVTSLAQSRMLSCYSEDRDMGVFGPLSGSGSSTSPESSSSGSNQTSGPHPHSSLKSSIARGAAPSGSRRGGSVMVARVPTAHKKVAFPSSSPILPSSSSSSSSTSAKPLPTSCHNHHLHDFPNPSHNPNSGTFSPASLCNNGTSINNNNNTTTTGPRLASRPCPVAAPAIGGA